MYPLVYCIYVEIIIIGFPKTSIKSNSLLSYISSVSSFLLINQKFNTMRSKSETLEDQPKPLTLEEKKQQKEDMITCFIVSYLILMLCCFSILLAMLVPDIKIVHMSFTTDLNNNITTQQAHYLPLVSARWDLLIRVPAELVGDYICLQGNLLYKNATLVTSSVQRF